MCDKPVVFFSMCSPNFVCPHGLSFCTGRRDSLAGPNENTLCMYMSMCVMTLYC